MGCLDAPCHDQLKEYGYGLDGCLRDELRQFKGWQSSDMVLRRSLLPSVDGNPCRDRGSEASVTGGMCISEGLRGARHAFVLAGLGLLIVTMLTGLNSSEMLIRQRCRTTVWALFPLALLFSLLAMLRFLNIGLAADVVLLSLIPFAICTVVWVLVLEEAQLLAPLSIKVEVLWKIFMRQGKIDARSLSDSLEQAMILSALRRSENNKAEAARLLGLSKSTFHRKASRYLPRPAAEVSPVSSELVAHEEEGSALATTQY